MAVLIIRVHGNFSVRGSSRKICWGDVGGIQMFKVLSMREIFSCFFPNFLKLGVEITSFSCRGMWAEMLDKFSDGGFGQGINKIFQEGDMDGDYCKILRRGKWTGRNVKNSK